MFGIKFFEALESRVLLTGSPYEGRGWVSLIVDNTLADAIDDDLVQLEQDELGDGWTAVSPHTNAPRMDDENYVWNNSQNSAVTLDFDEDLHNLDQYKADVQTVKNMIADDAEAAEQAGSHLAQIVIIGHVTAPYSGLMDYDGGDHGRRAFPVP